MPLCKLVNKVWRSSSQVQMLALNTRKNCAYKSSFPKYYFKKKFCHFLFLNNIWHHLTVWSWGERQNTSFSKKKSLHRKLIIFSLVKMLMLFNSCFRDTATTEEPRNGHTEKSWFFFFPLILNSYISRYTAAYKIIRTVNCFKTNLK